jgi:hypothetical protein
MEETEPVNSNRPASATASHSNESAGRTITVFGQVVADDTLGDVYVVPLSDILNDIKHVFEAQEARLPESSSEINAVLRMMSDTAIANSKNAANQITPTRLVEDNAGALPGPSARIYCTQCGSEHHTERDCPLLVTSSKTPSRSLVWFCHFCNEGPISAWQNICTECNHEKCSWCRHEQEALGAK